MKNIRLLLIAVPFILFSCSKGGDSPTPPSPPPVIPAESALAFAVTQDPGVGNILAVLGTSQIINVKVSSTLPTAGVNIDVTVKKELDNSTVFTASASSVALDNSVTIIGLTPGVICTVTIVVTSKSTSTNNKTATFKLAAK